VNIKSLLAVFAAVASIVSYAECKCGKTPCKCPTAGTVKTEKADESKKAAWEYNPGEGVSFGDTTVITASFGAKVDSKYITYGLVDNKDPITTLNAEATICDWMYIGVDAIFDMTKYGRASYADYSNRGGKYTELDPYIALTHDFSSEDYSWMPEWLGTLSLSLEYCYEYHPRSMRNYWDIDSQFVSFYAELSDLYLEPELVIERDIDRDDGTYVNLSLGHTFVLVGSKDEPVLTFKPAVAQGFGNTRRVKYYLYKENGEDPLDHAGLMDTRISGTLEWQINDYLSFSAYVAYSDFLFDRSIRHAARGYEGNGYEGGSRYDESYNFIGGVGLTVSF
jgi:hypothetical protein